MSIKTWKAEFYGPIKNLKRRNPANIVEHALHKWKGLTKKNLKKHNLHWDDLYGSEIFDDKGKTFYVDENTCSLCIFYFTEETSCDNCPIRIVTGGDCCDEYGGYFINRDAKPMIKLLERTLKGVKNAKD